MRKSDSVQSEFAATAADGDIASSQPEPPASAARGTPTDASLTFLFLIKASDTHTVPVVVTVPKKNRVH